MTDLRKAAKEALWAFQYHVEQTWPTDRSTAAIAALRAALAQQEEPVTEDMKSAVRWAPSSAYWSQQLRGLFGPDAREGIDALERRLAEAQQAEPVEPVATLIAQRDALLELVVEMDQHEGAEGWSEDLRVKINAALMAMEETK